ncbi:MAG: phospholipid carrier-dependent glycosyltransferase [Glaciihabitans sp.]|jgi:dolichyl-phosphate-mannose--protein O-mannosyl transferase|nr:phospholipid carrier-dependent glycosyltransferase [Glaciihabitans sp.]MDQ1571948.1 dolichyl-phosphate-mannose-protein mannosyltransferase [Actinomycetota bacterium]
MDSGSTDFDELVTAADQPDTPQPGTSQHGTAPDYALEDRTGLDRFEDDFASTPGRERLLRWIGPILVTLIAAGTRLWNLANPHSLVFDETFYVKDAYTLSHLGYEAAWPANADTAFNQGDVNTYLTSPSFVVHPPLGKWIISLGFDVFGAQNPLSWRISTAVVGILAVILLMVIAQFMFRSRLVTTIAGLLFAIDGNAIVMSRVSLLDNFVMFFALLGFGAILLDRQWSATRLAVWIARRESGGKSTDWGPALWWRPWLILAGLAFGLDAAVKWNGLYFLAGLAIYTLIVDAVARRHAGIPFWLSGTIFKQAPTSFILTVPIALAAYLTSWTGWFVTKGGYDRTYADVPGNAWKGAFAWVPHAFQSFVRYQTEVYNYNINEHSPHPYSANPLTWLLMIRPTSMYYLGENSGANGCTSTYCGTSITGIANPLIWWGGSLVALYLVYRLIRFREWRVGIILAGLAAGYLPWLLYTNRTVFQFYTIAFEPYLILGLAFVASMLIGARGDPPAAREWGIRWVAVFVVLAVAISVFFWPLWAGIQIDYNFLRAHWWLTTWR